LLYECTRSSTCSRDGTCKGDRCYIVTYKQSLTVFRLTHKKGGVWSSQTGGDVVSHTSVRCPWFGRCVGYELEAGGLRYWLTTGVTVPHVLTRDMYLSMYLYNSYADVFKLLVSQAERALLF
jgi:hypothetical protein